MSIAPWPRVFVIGLLSLFAGRAHSEDTAAQKGAEYHYTLVTVANEEIGVVFKYNRANELANIILSPAPPKGDNFSLTQDHVILAEDGSRIVLKAKWSRQEPRGLENISIAPERPRQPVERGQTGQKTYLLRTQEGAELKLTCTWNGRDIMDIQLERVEKAPAKAK